jgi:hypothetical protein
MFWFLHSIIIWTSTLYWLSRMSYSDIFFDADFWQGLLITKNSWFQTFLLCLYKLIFHFRIVLFTFFLILWGRNGSRRTLKSFEALFNFAINAWNNFSLIAIGSLMIIFDSLVVVVQSISPYSERWYIYVSSRWCLLIKNGVLLLMVVFVWVIFGAIYCLCILPDRVSSIQYYSKLLW